MINFVRYNALWGIKNTMIRLLSQVSAGATAVFVGYSSAVVLILEAASQLDSSPALQSARLLAVGLAMGISTIALSLYAKPRTDGLVNTGHCVVDWLTQWFNGG